jgi:group I intron endonuclease
MKIQCNTDDLLKTGVYIIRNQINNKIYIGSSVVSFLKRMWHHNAMLRNKKHKNSYLQSSYNKHGEENFIFEILENCEKQKCLEREQYWMDYYKSYDKKIGYNINPIASGTPNMSRETILKRAATMKRRYALGEIESPFKKGHTPWNKNKTKLEVDYSYLKVPKTITQTLIDSRIQRKKQLRNDVFPDIYVYDKNNNFLGHWNSAKDLEEFSLTKENDLPSYSRFKSERMGKPKKLLQSANINKSAKTGKPYKGLLFSYKPLHEEIHVEKLDKNGEG